MHPRTPCFACWIWAELGIGGWGTSWYKESRVLYWCSFISEPQSKMKPSAFIQLLANEPVHFFNLLNIRFLAFDQYCKFLCARELLPLCWTRFPLSTQGQAVFAMIFVYHHLPGLSGVTKLLSYTEQWRRKIFTCFPSCSSCYISNTVPILRGNPCEQLRKNKSNSQKKVFSWGIPPSPLKSSWTFSLEICECPVWVWLAPTVKIISNEKYFCVAATFCFVELKPDIRAKSLLDGWTL